MEANASYFARGGFLIPLRASGVGDFAFHRTSNGES